MRPLQIASALSLLSLTAGPATAPDGSTYTPGR